MDDNAVIRSEAERLRASGVLGEARLRRLFDYLVESTLAGQTPKEIAIAVDVFGKNAEFDVGQDALVRVYVHKLRRTLEECYAAPENESRPALQVPKGDYRLKVVAAKGAIAVAEPAAVALPPLTGRQSGDSPLTRFGGAARVSAALGVLALLVTGITWMAFWRPARNDLDQVRANPVWASVLKDDRPIRIVVGDYYLIGETDSLGVTRLIREYTVNSKSDLEQFVAEHPEVADRYMDVGLRYLPVSSAFALRDVMAILAPQNRRITVSKMSDVEPASLKSDDIVYIGFLSGMGMLQDLMFTPESRFTVGDSYDEVIDKKTRHSYISQVGGQVMLPPQPSGKEQPYHDYGVFAKFRGPGGNTILVISGTRDEGVSQTAETFTSAQRLQEFAQQADLNHQLEALLEVSGVDGVNLSGKLVLESNRDAVPVLSTADARAAVTGPAGQPAPAATVRAMSR